ncbi:nuclear GTP-binding protein nug1 [Tieghemiomyces parasiticus]|uniref:Nuclear GTP-binding protein nug1 n=1 Tax=Tieghemiomyces parasiticus TaxID=78921 RepID=A0A9W8DUS1_9FUNG|nr:nuclear GTP-binding protein nug1 [Tieghemiomyces parasiticus]
MSLAVAPIAMSPLLATLPEHPTAPPFRNTMVAKKRQSKRLTGKIKAKIVKGSREKKRQERKKGPDTRKSRKDPGIPNLWPFKEKLLNQIEESRVRAEEEKQRKREMRTKMHDLNRGISGSSSSISELAANAQARGEAFDEADSGASDEDDGVRDLEDAGASGRRDNSIRAYYREFRKVVDNADVILEVLDARDPVGCRTKSIERLILNAGTDKRIILVLNKIDLVPRENVEAWLKYLRNEFPTVAFKASTQSQRTNLGHSSSSASGGSGASAATTPSIADHQLQKSECVGADALVQLLKNYCRNLNLKTSITVGVIGYPNVGKSSLINSLRRAKVCQVGSTPGVTKAAQTIHLDKNIKLLDSPGIVFARGTTGGRSAADVVLRNCIKTDLLSDPITPIEAILSRCNHEHIAQLYGIPAFRDAIDFLVQVARKRGKMARNGIPDQTAAAKVVLNDWNNGNIRYYTIPPVERSRFAQSTEIVQGWSREFDLAAVTATADQATLAEGFTATAPAANGVAAYKTTTLVGNVHAPVAVTVDGDEMEAIDRLMTEEEMAAVDEANAVSSDEDEEFMSADENDSEDEGASIDMDHDDDDDDDDEAMDTSSNVKMVSLPPRKIQTTTTTTTRTTKVTFQTKPQVFMTPEEELINPQNRNAQRKLLKKAKKAQRRQEMATRESLEARAEGDEMMEGEEEDGDGGDSYNFATYFKKPAVVAEVADEDDSEEEL